MEKGSTMRSGTSITTSRWSGEAPLTPQLSRHPDRRTRRWNKRNSKLEPESLEKTLKWASRMSQLQTELVKQKSRLKTWAKQGIKIKILQPSPNNLQCLALQTKSSLISGNPRMTTVSMDLGLWWPLPIRSSTWFEPRAPDIGSCRKKARKASITSSTKLTSTCLWLSTWFRKMKRVKMSTSGES